MSIHDVLGEDVRVAAGIVTYCPERTELRACLESIVRQVDMVVIVDNGSSNASHVESLALEHPSVLLMKNTDNLGVGTALNQALTAARDGGCDWVVTFDQDSIAPPSMVAQYMEYMVGMQDCGALTLLIEYANCPGASVGPRPKCEEVDWCITSGCATSVSAWSAVGGFDEDLFIDLVDYDFCVRLRRAGYRVLRVNTLRLLHRLGDLSCHNVLGRVVRVGNHSPSRKYYLVRNRLILGRKLGLPRLVVTRDVFVVVTKVMLFESSKCMKLASMWRGLRDGLAMKGGPLRDV